MRKKILSIWLVATMLAAGTLVSCGSDDSDSTKESENKENADKQESENNEGNTERAAYTPLQSECGTIPTTDIKLADAKNPAEVTKAMGMGWNLGNQFDAHNNGTSGETLWGQPKATQQTFDKVAAAGIKTVRIPVTWMGHIGSAPDYKIEEAWLDRIYEVVEYAEKAGLNAIINIHHDGSDSKFWLNIKGCATNENLQKNTIAQLSAMWTQIAEKFKDKDHFLMFELLNEIQDGKWGSGDNRTDGGKQYAAMNEWLQAMVDAIRATGGKNTDRWIGVPAYNTNTDLSKYLVLPDDPAHKLMVSIHYYSPYEYTLNYVYQEWGHIASKTTNYGQEKDCEAEMKKLYTRYTSKGIPVYIGEMGNVNRLNESGEKFRAYYFEYVVRCIHNNYMPAILWDNGVKDAGKECHGYFNHGTGEWMNDYSQQMIATMVKAMTNEDKGYTLQSIYNAMK
ncbi:MAG: glycoside hydrolase family 5 protein [Bacteroidales bacterium]|nr:glycoside hydrolase family 5 protein [Bacteroidales bacterium]